MSDRRWSTEQVLALAPDAAAQRAARGLATARPWQESGYAGGDPPSLWGLCRGSGSKPYQTCVDLTEPAYRCSCPSRKFPCKHALGLLLWWAQGGVDAAEPPVWVKEWHAGRAARAERKSTSSGGAARRGPVSERAQARRAERVGAGLDELDRWLADQVRGGLAGLSRVGYAHWDAMAARLVDAQAPGAASAVRRLASVATDTTGEQLLAELALMRLLVSAYRRIDVLPDDLAATVRARVGLPVSSEQVLASVPVRDRWHVLAVRDQFEERFTTRMVWMHGIASSRFALVLSFAAPGQPLAADLVVGTVLDADLCFFPGAQPLRALVAARRGAPEPGGAPAGSSVTQVLDNYATALAAEPWLDRWPALVTGALTRTGPGWHLVDAVGDGLPLDTAVGEPWWLVAAAGGRPLTVAGEWGPAGLRPLTGWVDGRLVRC
jgi:SWIM zinc finger